MGGPLGFPRAIRETQKRSTTNTCTNWRVVLDQFVILLRAKLSRKRAEDEEGC